MSKKKALEFFFAMRNQYKLIHHLKWQRWRAFHHGTLPCPSMDYIQQQIEYLAHLRQKYALQKNTSRFRLIIPGDD